MTQTTCLHDLLWWFVAALTPTPVEPEPESKDKDESVGEVKADKKEEHVSCGLHKVWSIQIVYIFLLAFINRIFF